MRRETFERNGAAADEILADKRMVVDAHGKAGQPRLLAPGTAGHGGTHGDKGEASNNDA